MFFKNIFFTIIIVTVFFGGVEFVLMAFGVNPVPLSEDPLVGFAENVPQFMEATQADGSVVIRTANNKRGLLNYQEFPGNKGGNSYRIFCMGGSTTYGRPYADRVSFCGWLREYLNATDPSRNWEVINAGGISFASYRVARLMNELKQYKPDLFIIYSGQNEFLEERTYRALVNLPLWLINLHTTVSGTRIYSVMKDMINAVQSDSLKPEPERYRLASEVDEILNHTLGPQSYHRDDVLKRQVITHYRFNLLRMVKIARSVDADVILVQPAINIKDMSPFKSEHKDGLDKQAQENWEELYQRAMDYFKAGQFNEALINYRQALGIDDRYADIHYRIGKTLFALGQYIEAEKSFRRAVEEDVAPLRILGSMQRIVEEVAASENVPLIDFPGILRDAYLKNHEHTIFGKEFFPDHVHTNMEGYRLLGLALVDQLIGQGIATPGDGWNTARIEAIAQEVVASIDPVAEGYTMMNLGKVLDWAGKYSEAHEAFMRSLEIFGPDPVIYDRLARTSFALGNDNEAMQYLNNILSLAPEMPGVYVRLAIIYEKQGEIDKAITHCQTELELVPDNFYAHRRLARLFEKQGDAAAAIRQYKTVLELKPNLQYAHLELAYLLTRQKSYDKALVHAREALRINPDQPRTHNALGLIMKKQGKLKQAVDHFTEAVRLDPDNTIAKQYLQGLQMKHYKLSSAGDLSE